MLRNLASGSGTAPAETYEFTAVDFSRSTWKGKTYPTVAFMYIQNFPDNTPLSATRAAILHAMPSDAKASPVVIDHNGGSCGQFSITSETLAKTFASPNIGGDPRGTVWVELQYAPAKYSPSNIQSAIVGIATAFDPSGRIC
jgi:hypothetical protein